MGVRVLGNIEDNYFEIVDIFFEMFYYGRFL